MPAAERDRTSPFEGRLNVPLKALLRGFERFFRQTTDTTAQWAAADWFEPIRADENLEEPPAQRCCRTSSGSACRGGWITLLDAYQIPHPSYNYFEEFGANADGPWGSTPQMWEARHPSRLVRPWVRGRLSDRRSRLRTHRHGRLDRLLRPARFQHLDLQDGPEQGATRPIGAPTGSSCRKLTSPFSQTGFRPPSSGICSAWPRDPHAFSMANSFGGAPPLPPMSGCGMSERRRGAYVATQLLIVSVMGTYEEYQGDEMVQNSRTVAKQAEEARRRGHRIEPVLPKHCRSGHRQGEAGATLRVT